MHKIMGKLNEINNIIFFNEKISVFKINFLNNHTKTRIVEKNPSKFKIDNKELVFRRRFIEETREEVKVKIVLI